MLSGFQMQPYMIIAGGFSLFALLAFQVLVGLRKIKFKGALHSKVHKIFGYVILGFAAFHGLGALLLFGVIG